MDPQNKLAAIAFTRAAVEEDQEAIAVLLHEQPLDKGLLTSLTAMAASTMEEAHGRAGALERLDHWARMALAECAVAEERRQ